MTLAATLPACDRQPPQSTANPPPSAAANPKQNPSQNTFTPFLDNLKPELQPIAALIAANQNRDARSRLEQRLSLNPDDGQAQFLLGFTFYREKEYDQALHHFDRALALPPLHPPVHYFRGRSLLQLGQLDEARAALHTFLQHHPGSPDAHNALGRIAHQLNDPQQAQQHFQRAIQLLYASPPPHDRRELATTHARLAEVLEARGDLQQAKLNLLIAIELYPDQYQALRMLSGIHAALGETADAQAAHAQYLAVRQRLGKGGDDEDSPDR